MIPSERDLLYKREPCESALSSHWFWPRHRAVLCPALRQFRRGIRAGSFQQVNAIGEFKDERSDAFDGFDLMLHPLILRDLTKLP